MALLPKNRTPVPSHRELHILLISGFIITALLLLLFAPRAGHENNAEPVGKEYYVKAQKDESWIEKFAGDPVALFTLVLTGATIGLYMATRSLFVATEKLVIGAEDNALRQLRAYISIERGVVYLSFINGVPHIQGNIVFSNSGNTPAYKFRTGIQAGLHASNVVPFRNERQLDTAGPSILGPRSQMQYLGNGIAISEADLARLRTQESAIFIWGCAAYEDHAENRRHYIYRTWIAGAEIVLPENRVGWLLSPHPAGCEAN